MPDLVPTKSKNPDTRIQYLVAKRIVVDDLIKQLEKVRREVVDELNGLWKQKD